VDGGTSVSVVDVSVDTLCAVLNNVGWSWRSSIVANEMRRTKVGVYLRCELFNRGIVELDVGAVEVLCAVKDSCQFVTSNRFARQCAYMIGTATSGIGRGYSKSHVYSGLIHPLEDWVYCSDEAGLACSTHSW